MATPDSHSSLSSSFVSAYAFLSLSLSPPPFSLSYLQLRETPIVAAVFSLSLIPLCPLPISPQPPFSFAVDEHEALCSRHLVLQGLPQGGRRWRLGCQVRLPPDRRQFGWAGLQTGSRTWLFSSSLLSIPAPLFLPFLFSPPLLPHRRSLQMRSKPTPHPLTPFPPLPARPPPPPCAAPRAVFARPRVSKSAAAPWLSVFVGFNSARELSSRRCGGPLLGAFNYSVIA